MERRGERKEEREEEGGRGRTGSRRRGRLGEWRERSSGEWGGAPEKVGLSGPENEKWGRRRRTYRKGRGRSEEGVGWRTSKRDRAENRKRDLREGDKIGAEREGIEMGTSLRAGVVGVKRS